MVLRLTDPWSNSNLEMLVFEERGKPEYPDKNLSEQEREPTTNSTHRWRRRWDLSPRHIGGRRALSPLRHPLLPKYSTFKKLVSWKSEFRFWNKCHYLNRAIWIRSLTQQHRGDRRATRQFLNWLLNASANVHATFVTGRKLQSWTKVPGTVRT